MPISFLLDGAPVTVSDQSATLLDALRDDLGVRAPKDGCSPQGQCGCCTVLVDGAARVACVTPVRRVAGRAVTTVDGLDPAIRARWADAFCAAGASQCGFCTPGIVVRLAALAEPTDAATVERALLAHLCRCTGWRTILEAAAVAAAPGTPSPARDLAAASARAAIESGGRQQVGPHVALGRAGFADDVAPPGALVAVPDGRGGWALGETLREARAAAGKVQGRRSTVEERPPIEVPDGPWVRTLQTSWVEPAYLETDASWCEPGGEPASPLANGGAFGAKLASPAPAAARRLADETGRCVRVLLSREDTVRLGPKRPPIAAGVDAQGRISVRLARSPGAAEAMRRWFAAAGVFAEVDELDVAGPAVSADLRGAGWAEAAALAAAARGVAEVVSPAGARASAAVGADGSLRVRVACGEPLDEVVLRSYCVGAAHMAASWVTSEALAVSAEGEVEDLTVRSFGVLRALDTPPIEVEIEPSAAAVVNGGDAVFAAVAAAVWAHQGFPPVWPTRRPLRASR
ncbi:MAG: 2Fe-2S iron-sulfur cluster-binding protein [Acidimicrobiales bacterium]